MKVGEFLSPLHAMAAPEHLDWDHDRIMAETTSSEDELLSSTTEGDDKLPVIKFLDYIIALFQKPKKLPLG